jgi:hypothetical protein
MSVRIGNETANFNPLFGGKIGKSHAVLYIFPPQRHTMQVVRPYVYQFNNELAHSMVGGDPYGIRDMNAAPECMRGAVMPGLNGEMVDTYALDSYHSFLLIIDDEGGVANLMNSGAPPQRSILVGYFLDEPVAPLTLYSSTPVVNPNAAMLFTHVDMVAKRSTYGRGGVTPSLDVTDSCDFVHQTMAQNFTPAMALCDYSSIAHSHGYNDYGKSMVRNRNPLTISEMSRNAAHVPEELKSPRQHLVGIIGAAQRTSSVIGDFSGHSPINNEMGISDDPYSAASAVMMGAMQKKPLTHALLQMLDPTKVVPLHQLMTICGDSLHVRPCGIENRPQFDLADPRSLAPESIMSSMVTNTVAAYCRTNTISMIQFRYNSWEPGASEYQRGKWEVKQLSVMVMDDGGASAKTFLERFKYLMETGLFPLLKTQVGEFDLIVSFDSSGDTGVCLNVLDNGVIRNEFHVQHNRLGGMVNPNLGSFDALSNNQNQLNTLFNAVVNDLTSQHMPHDPGYADMMTMPDDFVSYGGDDTFL